MIMMEPTGSLTNHGASQTANTRVRLAHGEPPHDPDSTNRTSWSPVDGLETGSTNGTYAMQPAPVDPRHTGAPTSLEALYTAQRDRLLGYLERLVGDRATAEDLLHDTFVKALRAWSTRDRTASANAWVYRIATNTAYDELRRRRRARVTSLTDGTLAAVAGPAFDDRVVDADVVHRALVQLPAAFRAALLLQVVRGQRIDEIADQLNVAVGTVKSRLHRGRAHVRQAYDAKGGTEPSMPPRLEV